MMLLVVFNLDRLKSITILANQAAIQVSHTTPFATAKLIMIEGKQNVGVVLVLIHHLCSGS